MRTLQEIHEADERLQLALDIDAYLDQCAAEAEARFDALRASLRQSHEPRTLQAYLIESEEIIRVPDNVAGLTCGYRRQWSVTVVADSVLEAISMTCDLLLSDSHIGRQIDPDFSVRELRHGDWMLSTVDSKMSLECAVA